MTSDTSLLFEDILNEGSKFAAPLNREYSRERVDAYDLHLLSSNERTQTLTDFTLKTPHAESDNNSLSSSTTISSSQRIVVTRASTRPQTAGSLHLQRVKVEAGLFDKLPPSAQVASKEPPCAMLAVVDSSGEVVSRNIKTYEQLRNFSEFIQQTLEASHHRPKALLTDFPPKGFFSKNIPWQVDVRNDMLNAYFKTVAWLFSNRAIQKDRNVMVRIEKALTALLAHDIVDVPLDCLKNGKTDGEMWGFLLSRPNARSKKWHCRYYVLNGAYVDVRDSISAQRPMFSISLHNAHIQKKIVFFNAREDDERYVFNVFEQRPSGTKLHILTAENENIRMEWIQRLRARIDQINSKEISSKSRFYGDDHFPKPFVLREPNQKSLYLTMSSGVDYLKSELDSEAEKNSTSSLSLQRNGSLNRRDKNNNSNGIFDGEDFYMRISESRSMNSTFNSDMPRRHNTDRSHEAQQIPESISISGPILTDHSRAMDRDVSYNDLQVNIAKIAGAPPTTGRIFGVMPEFCHHLVVLANGDRVPSIVARCLERLAQPGTYSEIGIFRISGTQKLIDELQYEFDTKGDFDITGAKIDVHTTADLLKRYLRSLPGYLLGEWNENKSKSLLTLSEADQIQVFRIEFSELAGADKAVVRSIIRLLHEVSKNEAVNSMGARNLGLAVSTALKVPAPLLTLIIQHERHIL